MSIDQAFYWFAILCGSLIMIVGVPALIALTYECIEDIVKGIKGDRP